MSVSPTPEPLTQEQLDWISAQTDHAVKKAVRRVTRRAAVGFVVLLAGLGGQYAAGSHDAIDARHATVQSGRAVAVDGCNRDFRSIDSFRGLVVRLKVANEQAYKRAPVKDPDAYAAAQKFYTDTLGDYRYPDCGRARSIVTDDPATTIVVPRPLSKKDARNADIKAASKRIAKGG